MDADESSTAAGIESHLFEDPYQAFVDGFPSYFTEKQVREFLESFGQLCSFELVTDSSTYKDEKAAYFSYEDESVTDTACTALSRVKLHGRTLIARCFNHRSVNQNSRLYCMFEAICWICSHSLEGQAIFTAECSHRFHYSCIANNVEYGNLDCPVCGEEWNKNNVPFQVSPPKQAETSIPSTMPNQNQGWGFSLQGSHPPEPLTFKTDKPLKSSSSPLDSSPYPNGISKTSAERVVIGAIDSCAICSCDMKIREAIFTAECSHHFHYPCIAKNVEHGNLNCPVCRAKWDMKNVPFQVLPPKSAMLHQHEEHPPEPSTFTDDEPLKPSLESSPHENVTFKTCLDRAAIASAESNTKFPVLLTIRGPPLHDSGRMSIDLVIILDARSTLRGMKLHCFKRAAEIVLENLSSSDRLSIVSLSSTSRRVLPLQRMTDDGRESAILAINSLETGGVTSIVEALKKSTKVLEDRRDKNPVACIMLFSNGVDSQSYRISTGTFPSIFPVHTFGFDNERNLQAISNASGGTYSSVTLVVNRNIYVGPLLSVVAKEISVTVCAAATSGVKITSIPSRKHVSQISDDGNKCVVNIRNIHAEEEVHLLLYLSVLSSASSAKTPLLDVTCAYRDLATDKCMQVVCSPAETEGSFEFDPERARSKTDECTESALKLAEMGDMKGASTLLAEQRDAMLLSSEAVEDGVSFKYEVEKLEQKIALVEFCCTDLGRAEAPGILRHWKAGEMAKEHMKQYRKQREERRLKREERRKKTVRSKNES